MFEKIKSTPVEELPFKQGFHAYLLKDEKLTRYKDREERRTLEKIQEQMDKEAEFVGKVRQQVEAQGGKFNGIQTLEVDLQDPEYLGSAFPHRLTFVFVDLP